jgi:hypothetical protein
LQRGFNAWKLQAGQPGEYGTHDHQNEEDGCKAHHECAVESVFPPEKKSNPHY